MCLRISALLAELKACKNLARGKQLHEAAILVGKDSELCVANALINMYGKCGSLKDCRSVFNRLGHRDVVSWNTLIQGHVYNGEHEMALALLSSMRRESCAPDARTFLAAFKACINLAVSKECLLRGRALQLLAARSGCDSDMFVGNALVDMLSKFGCMQEAQRAFDNVDVPDVVSWASLILGYADNGNGAFALNLFTRMSCAPNARAFVGALKACTELALKEDDALERGKVTHLLASSSGCDSDMYVQTTLVDLYVKCGSIAIAQAIFEGMHHRNVVSWTALMVGYADIGEATKVLELFTRMKREGCQPNAFTFVSVLKACGMLGALDFGRAVHAELRSRETRLDVVLANSLVDFYARCGSLSEADSVCSVHPGMNLVTWTSLITGFCHRGDAAAVFGLFERMHDAGVQANKITFLCVLTACSHAGLVDRGKEYFASMSTRYGIQPEVEHYSCVIGMLSRANKVDDAMALLRSMKFSPDSSTWMTVLGSCRKWKNAKLASLAFEALLSLDDENSVAYQLMANTL